MARKEDQMYSTHQPIKEELKVWRKAKVIRKFTQLEKLVNRRSIKRRTKLEILRLADALQ